MFGITSTTKLRIKPFTAFFLIAAALAFDVAQFLISLIGGAAAGTGVGIALTAMAAVSTPLLTFVAGLTFWLWFRLLRVSFASPKKALSFGGALVAEFIPIVNALPAWTASVVSLIIMTTYEDVATAEKSMPQKNDSGYNT